MDLDSRFRANIRSFYFWLLSVVILGITPIAAIFLIARETLVGRLAGVAVGILGALPWMWAVLGIIRRNDEYGQRIHLVGTAIGFMGGLMLTAGIHWLEVAGFIDRPIYLHVWIVQLVLWVLGVVAAKFYFERSA